MSGSLRQRRRRQKQRCIRRIIVVCVAAFGLVLGSLLYCRPVMTAFAESQAVWIATKTANRVVAEVLAEQAELCRAMVEVQYNDRQILSSLFVDTAAINTVRTAITAAVMQEMEPYAAITVGIPLGTLAGFDWLSGWGPLVKLPMSVTSTVLSDVTASLEAVGMNQSSFRVLVHISVSLYVVTPGGRTSVTAEQSYPMAEAVLLGEVPDNLTEVYGDDQTLLGKIFDYGTIE